LSCWVINVRHCELLTEEERVVERREQRAGSDGNRGRDDGDSLTSATQSNH